MLSRTRRVHFLLAPLKNLSEVSKFCHLHFRRRKKNSQLKNRNTPCVNLTEKFLKYLSPGRGKLTTKCQVGRKGAVKLDCFNFFFFYHHPYHSSWNLALSHVVSLKHCQEIVPSKVNFCMHVHYSLNITCNSDVLVLLPKKENWHW